MKTLIVMSSPNPAGLTVACAEAARQGIVDGHSPARVVNVNDLKIARCAVCDDGWGSCRSEHRCRQNDDFQSLHDSVRQAEGYVFVTPVYFGEPSEPLKAVFDRLRRCEATRDASSGESSALSGKPAIGIAAAGGSGHGALHCLEGMERLLQTLGADVFDTIPVTRRTRDYQLETIHDALVVMATSRPAAPAAPQDEKREERGRPRPRGRRRR